MAISGDATDEFYDRLTLFNTSMVAHMARILDRAGLMDDETHRLIHHNLRLLSETAERCDDDETTTELVDLLVSILPPGKP